MKETNTFYNKLTNSTYSSTKFSIGKNKWSVMIVTGDFNYINVTKLSTPWMTLGTDFPSWKSVMAKYKNEKMRTELMKIELGI